MVKYMSPTQLRLFEKDKESYYITYLAENRAPRPPQTEAMAVGSSFDAYIKSDLYHRIYGDSGDSSERFDFDNLFMEQVEAANRNKARIDGKDVFDKYVRSGALSDLLLMIGRGIKKPRFEVAVVAEIECGTLLGKPDMILYIEDGNIIHDWKVNGYYSQASPKRGYVELLPDRKMHKDTLLLHDNGIYYNGENLEDISTDWADQLGTYGLIIGSVKYYIIHQLVFRSGIMRVGVFIHKIGKRYIEKLVERYTVLWRYIQNHKRNEMLETIAKNYSKDDELMRSLTGRG